MTAPSPCWTSTKATLSTRLSARGTATSDVLMPRLGWMKPDTCRGFWLPSGSSSKNVSRISTWSWATLSTSTASPQDRVVSSFLFASSSSLSPRFLSLV